MVGSRSDAHSMPGRSVGFTLIEVIIVVAVIAILSAVAYPSYLAYITRANRVAAEGFMLEVANRQERYLLDRRAYSASIGSLVSVPPNVSANYTVTTTVPRTGAPTTTSYTVDAVPGATQLARDAACGTLTIDETGTKSISGTGTVSTCWRQ